MPMPTRTKLPCCHGGGEDEKLAVEAGGEGNSGEREHGDEHPEGEEGRAFGEAVEVHDVVAARVLRHDDEDEEGEQRHQEIAREVIGHRDAGAPNMRPLAVPTLATAISR